MNTNRSSPVECSSRRLAGRFGRRRLRSVRSVNWCAEGRTRTGSLRRGGRLAAVCWGPPSIRALGRDGHQESAAIRPPHENESFLVRRMLVVTDEGTAQIIERALRLLERHAVFPEIRGRFLRVPLELAGHWWP